MLNRADIEKIIAGQGYELYLHERNSTRGDGVSRDYAHLRKPGMRRPIYLGAITKLSQMSEAGLVALIAKKTKSVQGAAQKGKE